MLGIGIDIVDIDRMRNLLNGDDGSFLNKVFTKREIFNSRQFKDTAEYFSILFAFKESFVKAKGLGFTSFTKPKHIEARVINKKISKASILMSISVYFKNHRVNFVNVECFKFNNNIVCGLIVEF